MKTPSLGRSRAAQPHICTCLSQLGPDEDGEVPAWHSSQCPLEQGGGQPAPRSLAPPQLGGTAPGPGDGHLARGHVGVSVLGSRPPALSSRCSQLSGGGEVPGRGRVAGVECFLELPKGS